MSFVRAKHVPRNGHRYGPYYEEVEGYRDEQGKVQQRVIRYLGRNPGRSSSSAKRQNGPPDAQPGADATSLAHDRSEAEREIDRSRRDARDILAKNEAQRAIIDDTEAPEDRKEQVKKERTRQAAEQLRKEKAQAQKSLDDYLREEVEASKRSRERWSAQRKKEAESISQRTGATAIQSDALNQRAKRAGRAYDEVDWDTVQGKDLTYSERVSKLDSQLGTSTRTKMDLARSSRQFESTVSKWERNPEEYQAEMEAASREMFFDMKAEVY